MSISVFNEHHYEQALISLFQQIKGYRYAYGPDMERDYADPLLEDVIEESLQRINPALPAHVISEAIRKLRHIEGASLYEMNFRFTLLMQNGIEVQYQDPKRGVRTAIVQLIDFDHVDENDFLVVNQFTVKEHDTKRADMVLFVNGLPLVVIELKSPSREETDASEAYLQLRNYQKFIPSLFTYNAFNVMSDMALTKVGTVTAKEERYMEWKQPSGEVADYDVAFREIFEPRVLLNLLKNYLLFDVREGEYAKILAGYHQYYAVEKAAVRVEEAVRGDGKIGVFWHTQGSGKSLSMVFLAHHPKVQTMNPTIVVVTDRNDLDEQLYGQFSRTVDFLRQRAVQSTSRNTPGDGTSLHALLKNRHSGGIIFTTMQKFDEWDGGALSDRQNIIVITDEAHRGQYGLEEKIDAEGNLRIGAARKIRNSLPHASYIGFTGTPISDRDRDTREIFGDYIDVYDMTQAVQDGATRPVFYESRVIKLKLDDEVLKRIDAEYDRLRAEGASETDLEANKKEMAHMDALLGNDTTVRELVADIVSHYEDCRAQVCGGKAMVVAYSRPIAMKIYNEMLQLRPDWQEKVKVVMTGGNQDPEEWAEIVGGKGYKKDLARKFKDVNDPMKIAIVVDMWLTGFDVPSLATMYVYKPMRDHNLMQAIARVNRVFPEKAGGLIVDYVGIAAALKEAMKRYSKRDQQNYGENNIRERAYDEFKEKLEICRDLMHGYDYSRFRLAEAAERAAIIKGGVNFMLDPQREEAMKEFVRHAALLHQAVTLCRSLLGEDVRFEVAFMEVVRTLLNRLTKTGKITKSEINKRIVALIEQSVKSEGVVNLFDEQTEFSLFDEGFMAEVRRMKEKNLAVKLLENLLRGRVRQAERDNVVQGTLFSERFSETLNRYIKGLLSNEEVIQELLKLAQEMMTAEKEGTKMGLSREEKAFYDALTRPEAVRDFYKHEELIALTHELTDMLRRNRTIDWNRREAERANMRRLVKRLLKKYKYPPEEAEDAMKVVLKQCELWAENQEEETQETIKDTPKIINVSEEFSYPPMAADDDIIDKYGKYNNK